MRKLKVVKRPPTQPKRNITREASDWVSVRGERAEELSRDCWPFRLLQGTIPPEFTNEPQRNDKNNRVA